APAVPLKAKKPAASGGLLTIRQAGFCRAYIELGAGAEAYKQTYPKSVETGSQSRRSVQGLIRAPEGQTGFSYPREFLPRLILALAGETEFRKRNFAFSTPFCLAHRVANFATLSAGGRNGYDHFSKTGP